MENFIGFKNQQMRKMNQDDVKKYLNYEMSFDPYDIPDNW